MILSSRDIFINLLHIFRGILYFTYKGSKFGLTPRWKVSLVRPRSDAPPLSANFIVKVQFIVEIISRRTHARRLTITFFYRLTMSCPFDHRIMYAECRLRLVHFVPFADPRSVMLYALGCMRDIDLREEPRGWSNGMMEKKKCQCAKERNGTHRKGDKLYRRRGFIRARYVTVIRDATRRESTSLRYFWATTPLSLDRQCVYSRDLTRESVVVAVVENHWEEKRKREMKNGCGKRGGGGERKRERERERFFLTVGWAGSNSSMVVIKLDGAWQFTWIRDEFKIKPRRDKFHICVPTRCYKRLTYSAAVEYRFFDLSSIVYNSESIHIM